MLPGGVIVAAALVTPEFSVGAGDLGGGEGLSDPPEPVAKVRLGAATTVQFAARPANSKLAGVRYAPIIDLGPDLPPALAAPSPDVASVNAPPAERIAAPALAVPPVTATATLRSVAAGTGAGIAPVPPAPPAALAAVMSQIPAGVAAAPVADAREAEAPVSSRAAPAPDALAFATFLPEEQAALRGPAGTVASAPSAPVAPATAAAPAVRTAPAPVAAVSAAAGRGAIEQLTPSRIAAARPVAVAAPAPAPAPAKPAPAPLAARPAVAAAVTAPGARAPLAAPPANPPAALVAAVPRPAPARAAPASAAPPQAAAFDFRAQLLTRIDGRTAGKVDFQQTPSGLKVRLGSVAEVLGDRLAPEELARIRNSQAGNAWLSLAELQSQGVPISYDPVYDEFNIGHTDTRPKAARKVHMDQISAPERGVNAAGMAQVPRPR